MDFKIDCNGILNRLQWIYGLIAMDFRIDCNGFLNWTRWVYEFNMMIRDYGKDETESGAD